MMRSYKVSSFAAFSRMAASAATERDMCRAVNCTGNFMGLLLCLSSWPRRRYEFESLTCVLLRAISGSDQGNPLAPLISRIGTAEDDRQCSRAYPGEYAAHANQPFFCCGFGVCFRVSVVLCLSVVCCGCFVVC